MILFVLVVNELEGASVFSLILFGLLVHFIAKVNVITFVQAYWKDILALAAVYVALGLGWSVAKWCFFVLDLREKYDQFLLDHKDTKFTAWDLMCAVGDLPPRAAKHKSEIVSWIAYWPISVLWTLLHDFFRKVFNRIYDLFAGVFQRISDSQFKGFEKPRD